MPDHDDASDSRPQRGIQSIEVGGQVLRAMAHAGQPMALKDLAREADMPAAKIHPYLVSFARIGLMEQDPESGRYFLGPLALQLGLISLKQANPVQAAAAELPALVATHRPHRGHRGVGLARRHHRAAGGVARADPREHAPGHRLLAGRHRHRPPVCGVPRDGARSRRCWTTSAGAEGRTPRRRSPTCPRRARCLPGATSSASCAEVRAHGLARSDGETLPGVNALAAPVFDHEGRIALAVTAIGPASIFDLAWDGAIARELRACAARISQRMAGGAPPVKKGADEKRRLAVHGRSKRERLSATRRRAGAASAPRPASSIRPEVGSGTAEQEGAGGLNSETAYEPSPPVAWIWNATAVTGATLALARPMPQPTAPPLFGCTRAQRTSSCPVSS